MSGTAVQGNRNSHSDSSCSGNGKLPTMGWNRGFVGSFNQIIESTRGIQNAYRSDSHGGPTTVTIHGSMIWIAGLFESPHRFDAGMNRFSAAQQLLPDGSVDDLMIA